MKSKSIFFTIFLTFLLGWLSLVFAEGNNSPSQNIMGDRIIFQTLPDKEKQDILKLKDTNISQFKEQLHEKIEARKKELQKIKQGNPQEFEQIMSSAKQKMRERIGQRKNRRKILSGALIFESLSVAYKLLISFFNISLVCPPPP